VEGILELQDREGDHAYVLCGRPVIIGDDLEVRHGSQWLHGTFYWDHDPASPALLFLSSAAATALAEVALTPGSWCRWRWEDRTSGNI